MLEINPDDREDITTLVEKYTQLETQLEGHLKSSRLRICVSIGPATTLASIDMSQVADDNEFVDQITSLFNKERNCGRGILAPLFQLNRVRLVNFIVPDNAKPRALDLKDALLDSTPSYEHCKSTGLLEGWTNLMVPLHMRLKYPTQTRETMGSPYTPKLIVNSIKELIERYEESELPMRAWGIEIQDGIHVKGFEGNTFNAIVLSSITSIWVQLAVVQPAVVQLVVVQLAVVAVSSLLFGICLTALTTAKRSDVFTATVTYVIPYLNKSDVMLRLCRYFAVQVALEIGDRGRWTWSALMVNRAEACSYGDSYW